MLFSQEIADRYAKEIGPELIESLPVMTWSGGIVVVDKPELVEPAVTELMQHDILGFDTETRPSFRKGEYHPVALIQLSTATTVYLFRLNLIGFPVPLQQLLANQAVIKVGIGLDNDLPELKKLHRFVPAGFVDLNKVVTSLGFINTGAKKLTALILGYRLSKTKQTSNWESEILTPGQLSYAAIDAWVCREIYLRLQGVE
ncbi:MAG: 3'-5' exonuclease domain-containing protein 2 [Bacteroidales bacterium]|nr:3'-5' exonuclease domain-containing protein 2 [Bacteroidales bacterium]MDD3664492.1 3'-5' exonuclease domain-containing protein 2 [Bacteroidales bacterium]